MSAPTRIFLDIFRQRLVAGYKSTATVSLAPFYYGEKREMEIALLEPNPDTNGDHPQPYVYVQLADFSLKVAVTDIGIGVIVPVVYQNTFDVSNDGHFFVGTLDFNNALVSAAITAAGGTSFDKYFEIVQDKGGILTPWYQQSVTVRARGISGLTAQPQPSDTPVSKEYVDGTFCPRERPQGWFELWTDENGVQYRLKVGTDGQLKGSPIS